jgi:NAD(P)-dependent dehydrogenase (short-subunit alcohol dehydrogenase family)
MLSIASRNSGGELDGLQRTLEGMGAPCLAVETDVAIVSQLDNLVEKTVARFGRIDVLVSNAGINPVRAPALEIDEATWDRTINVNLKAAFFICQRAGRVMVKQQSGCIVIVASVQGIRPKADVAPYAISKGGLITLTKSLARELGPRGIRVNAVAPGIVETDFTKHIWSNPVVKNERLKARLMSRMGTPDEIADVVLFLASDQASYMMGSIMVVDGGELL